MNARGDENPIRVGVASVSYLAACMVGAMTFVAMLFVTGDSTFLQPSQLLGIGAIVAVFGGVLALVTAFPVIVKTERRGNGSLLVFLVAGIGFSLGSLLIFVILARSLNVGWEFPAYFIIPSLAASLTYWFIAWCLFPPSEGANSQTSK